MGERSYAERWQSVVNDPGWWFWNGIKRLGIAQEMGADADAEIAALREQVAVLQAALSEAADNMEDWAAYADPYFQEKHDLAGDLRRARALLGEGGEG
jgi:hypothetical protein